LPFLDQFLIDVITILHETEVFEELEARNDPTNKWNIARQRIHDKDYGPAHGIEMPVGNHSLLNFKMKIVQDLWPKIAEIARNHPDNEPGPKYKDLAVVDYATYTEMKNSHDEAIAEKSKKVQEMKGQMEQVEISLGAVPPSIGVSGASTKQIRGNLLPIVILSVAAPAAAVSSDSTNNNPGHIHPSDLQFNPYEVFETSANNVLQGVSDTIKRDLSGLMKEFGVCGQEDKEVQKK
jgi:hypothetical protein